MFAKKIGIDLGTSSTRVYVRGEGIVVDEPTVAAMGDAGSRLLAVGLRALDLAERAPNAVTLVRPIRAGAIADPALVERVLIQLVARAQGRQRLFRPEVMICVPSAAGSRDRRAMTEAAIAAGARQAWLIERPLAVAMGLGLPVAESRAHAVCDVGAGCSDVAVISLSGAVAAETARVGGDSFDAAIAAWVRDRHGLVLDPRAAEAVKVALGSALRGDRPRSVEVTGRELDGSGQGVVTVTSAQVTEAIQEPLRAVTDAVRRVLEQTPRALAEDLRERGLHLAGGGALLRGLDRHLAGETGIPVRVADEPMTCAVRGTRRALGEFELLQRRQLYLR